MLINSHSLIKLPGREAVALSLIFNQQLFLIPFRKTRLMLGKPQREYVKLLFLNNIDKIMPINIVI